MTAQPRIPATPADDHRDGARRRRHLRADCAGCAGLCCVVPAFAASTDFAVAKPAGQPCGNLRSDFRCGIHDRLRREGFPGCTVYDCFGAGQQVVQITFGGRDWRQHPELAGPMFTVFPIVRQLHEFLWYLAEARELPAAGPLHDQLRHAYDHVDARTRLDPDALAELDLAALGRQVDTLLRRASELVRAAADAPPPASRLPVSQRPPDQQPAGGQPPRHLPTHQQPTGGQPRGRQRAGRGKPGRRVGPRADLIGADLRDADLVGRDLRGAYLIGTDLRGADLRRADLIGADLRGARLDGADLGSAIFLTQPQVDAARGDAGTRLPPALRRPAHWSAR